MKKDLNVDVGKLKENGFSIMEKFPMQELPPNNVENINKLMNFPLNFIEDDRASRTVFAEFPDEVVYINKENDIYHVLGASWNAIFLESENNNHVYIFDFDKSDFLFINSDLCKFVQCYCAKMSIIMTIRAYVLSFINYSENIFNEKIKNLHHSQSLLLKNTIKEFDSLALSKSEYWNGIIEQIDDGHFIDRPNLDYFVRRNKIIF